MLAYSIDVQGLKEITVAMRRAPQMVVEELENATTEADMLLEREVKERMPTGAHQLLRASVFHEETVSGFGVQGLVGTPMSYAVPVEIGTKPHFPPIEPLIDWVKAKFGLTSEKAARGAAFAVAKKISQRGTVGQFPFQLTFLAQTEQIERIFAQARDRIGARLVNG